MWNEVEDGESLSVMEWPGPFSKITDFHQSSANFLFSSENTRYYIQPQLRRELVRSITGPRQTTKRGSFDTSKLGAQALVGFQDAHFCPQTRESALHQFSSCGLLPQLLHGMWNLSSPTKGGTFVPYIARAKEIKIKLGILLQKPESAIDLVIPYNEKPEKPAKTQKPSLDEALQWRDSLDKLLQNNYGLASFKSFLKSEFSEENLEFWMACEDYKKIKSPVKMAETAKKIYEEFIQAEAPKEVNIDHFTKEITVKNLVEPSPSSFDVAQKRIHALMEKDSLPRFVRSEFYQEFIK
ncbi:hypothetical protein MJG53_001591 [Ovis ammon polii x Ovis aries]|uniref:Uncharacterized protein n=1 Tax=Ovis ammon polii x Ovis aries TaxID=2918886 RepID=A0ACB9VLG6_9CETA|nr:hypothetical protein MJG53_001591 [Ovis ammon polii x Ovis aries]